MCFLIHFIEVLILHPGKFLRFYSLVINRVSFDREFNWVSDIGNLI